MSWRDLLVIVKQLPPTSAFARAYKGDDTPDYSTTDHLLAGVINILQTVSWQLGGDGSAPKPEPFRLPGLPDPAVRDHTYKGDVMSIEEMDRRLAPYKPK